MLSGARGWELHTTKTTWSVACTLRILDRSRQRLGATLRPAAVGHRARAGYFNTDDPGGSELVFSSAPRPLKSPSNSLTREMFHQPTPRDTRFLTHEKCAGKRLSGPFETDLA